MALQSVVPSVHDGLLQVVPRHVPTKCQPLVLKHAASKWLQGLCSSCGLWPEHEHVVLPRTTICLLLSLSIFCDLVLHSTRYFHLVSEALPRCIGSGSARLLKAFFCFVSRYTVIAVEYDFWISAIVVCVLYLHAHKSTSLCGTKNSIMTIMDNTCPMQDCVVYLSKISGLDPKPYTSCAMQETPFLLGLVLNPLVEGLDCTSPSPSHIRSI
jgi:hypothetical protein